MSNPVSISKTPLDHSLFSELNINKNVQSVVLDYLPFQEQLLLAYGNVSSVSFSKIEFSGLESSTYDQLYMALKIDAAAGIEKAAATKCLNFSDFVLGNRPHRFTEQQIVEIIQFFPHLEELDFKDCTQLTDKSLIEIANMCPDLKILRVSCCAGLTDDSIIAMAKNCKKLLILDLRGCPQLTDKSIEVVANYCQDLRYLAVEDCSKLTASPLKTILQNCTKMEVLFLTGCPSMDYTELVLLNYNFPHVAFVLPD